MPTRQTLCVRFPLNIPSCLVDTSPAPSRRLVSTAPSGQRQQHPSWPPPPFWAELPWPKILRTTSSLLSRASGFRPLSAVIPRMTARFSRRNPTAAWSSVWVSERSTFSLPKNRGPRCYNALYPRRTLRLATEIANSSIICRPPTNAMATRRCVRVHGA